MKPRRKKQTEGARGSGAPGCGCPSGSARVRPGAGRGFQREVTARPLQGGLPGGGSAGRARGAGRGALRKLLLPPWPDPRCAPPFSGHAPRGKRCSRGSGAFGRPPRPQLGGCPQLRERSSPPPSPSRLPAPPSPLPRRRSRSGVRGPRAGDSRGGARAGSGAEERRLPRVGWNAPPKKCPGREALRRDGVTFPPPPASSGPSGARPVLRGGRTWPPGRSSAAPDSNVTPWRGFSDLFLASAYSEGDGPTEDTG